MSAEAFKPRPDVDVTTAQPVSGIDSFADLLRTAEPPHLPAVYGDGPLAPSVSFLKAITPNQQTAQTRRLEALRGDMNQLLAEDGIRGTVNGETLIVTRTSIIYRPQAAPEDVPFQRVRLGLSPLDNQPRILFALPKDDHETSLDATEITLTTTEGNNGALTFNDRMGDLELIATGRDAKEGVEYAGSVEGDIAIATDITNQLVETYVARQELKTRRDETNAALLAAEEQALIDEERAKRRADAAAARVRWQGRLAAVRSLLDDGDADNHYTLGWNRVKAYLKSRDVLLDGAFLAAIGIVGNIFLGISESAESNTGVSMYSPELSKPLECSATTVTHFDHVTINGKEQPAQKIASQICTDLNDVPSTHSFVVPSSSKGSCDPTIMRRSTFSFDYTTAGRLAKATNDMLSGLVPGDTPPDPKQAAELFLCKKATEYAIAHPGETAFSVGITIKNSALGVTAAHISDQVHLPK